MFSGLPDIKDFFIFASVLGALLLTALAVVLKLCGVLLLSWWWVLAPVPALLVVVVLIAGLCALLG
jgi:hypothetical protein